ncbi:hypothetical protein WOLCODRAFT_123713 [Wolfiporia cocos MD-104 SS10]|uniref:Uncharacterized protein n=1 Tax=Wolfiporia cocos (strain MD-104) TaxID=742152 RepID=A0A2H3JX23_WOLCO|nr:hypothetical protein WOLCODRAFT_123713 [Wolfiporia cocos MD-104 SS10]
MSSAQNSSSTIPTVKQTTSYTFLSQPPLQKKRPTQPLPTPPAKVAANSPKSTINRRRSATTSSVAAWIADIQPGSPAPLSPRRRSSIASPHRLTSSPRSRRPSLGSTRIPSATQCSFFQAQTSAKRITPSIKDFKHDLTAVGYASIFVYFPTTPSPAPDSHFDRRPTIPAPPIIPVPKTSEKSTKRGLKHFRSLSALKSRIQSKSTEMPSRAPSRPRVQPFPAVPVPTHSRSSSRDEVSKSKKSKYAKYRPPPLVTELALAQLADGGKVDEHMKRFAEAQARAGGAKMVNGKLVGVDGMWHDGEGGVWRDQDEEWEYAHLLGEEENYGAGEAAWERFGSEGSIVIVNGEEERRESVSSQDSDLDPRYAMQAEAERDDLAVFGSAVIPSAMRKPGMSVLALPSRSRREAPHLRKPEFLLDVFPVPDASPAQADGASNGQVDSSSSRARPTGKERRRPTPLALIPPTAGAVCPTNPLDDVRRDFIENSFAPAPAPDHVPAKHHNSRPADAGVPAHISSRSEAARKVALNNGKSSLNVRNLFKVMGGKKDM